MRALRVATAILAGTFLLGAGSPGGEEKPGELVTLRLQGLPPTEGRQLLVGDEAGNAYIVQLAENQVFEVDELGSVQLHSTFETDAPITGALKAAVGAKGSVWVFGFGPHFVRVFKDGKELDIEPPGPMITGMTVTGGRPTLALASAIPYTGTNLAKEAARPKRPALVVQLNADGEWEPWVERTDSDLPTREELTKVGLFGSATWLAGDEQGRLLMARRYKYELREYKRSGALADRKVVGDVELASMPEDVAARMTEAGATFDSKKLRPRSMIDAVAWSPEGEALILARAEGDLVLDRWIPALQSHGRVPLEGIRGDGPMQMAATRTGLLFTPVGSRDATLGFLSWESLRKAEWQDLNTEAQEDAAPAASSTG